MEENLENKDQNLEDTTPGSIPEDQSNEEEVDVDEEESDDDSKNDENE
jgi:hypothetical protein